MTRPTTSSAASGARPFTANGNSSADWARPGTARPPPTAAGAASASGTYVDHQYHHGSQYTYDLDEEDEDDESEPEDDVFAYLPPTTADLSAPSASGPTYHSSSAPHEPFSYRPDQTPSPSSAAHFLPASPEAPLNPNPYTQYTQHTSFDPPTYPRAESPPSTGSHIDDEGGYHMRRLEHVVTPHTASTREVHVSLPSTGAQGPGDEKRQHPDMDPDLESQEIAVLPKHRTTLSSPGGSMSHRAGTPSILAGSEGSIKMAFDFDAIDEEDSPYPEVRASVSNIDDPEMPALTFRMWVVGLTLLFIGTSMNVFLNFRQPAPSVVPTVLLLMSHPFGRLLSYILPIKTYRLPHWAPLVGGSAFSFNPGPWNIKEHVLVFIMGNVALNSPYAINVIVVAEHYYGINIDYWFSLILVLATQLTGFGLAGICRRFLVWPASMVWPQNLVTCTLLNTLHADDDEGTGGISRYRFFAWVCGCAFFWGFVPGFLWTGLATFSWVSWVAPNNIPLNQMMGSNTGLGMTFLAFDWNVISWIGSPLMIPWWAELHAFGSFVLFYWICVPALYYSNTWNFGRFPLLSSSPFDKFGNLYDVKKVTTNDTHSFDEEAFNNYSPLYLPVTYAMTYMLAFALSTAVIVHTALYHGRKLVNGFKRVKIEKDDIHAKLMRNYPEVPDWWYMCVFVLFFSLAIVANEVWHTGLPVWGILLAVLIPCIYILPSGFIYASTSQGVTINLLAQIIPGALIPGKPMANMMFKAYSIQTLTEATSFTQDLKLGHYVKVPPRATFMVQLIATTLAAFVQVGVKEWMFTNIVDICQDHQPARLTCPHNRVFLTSSAVFGLIGPSRQFGEGTLYHPELYALVVGALLPVPFWLWERYRPGSLVRYLNIPVLLTGVQYLPPATGINYSSWFLVGFIFQYLIRRKNFAWWSRFNYVASGALDSGTALSVIFIFLTLQVPKGGTLMLKWWGNTVDSSTADFKNLPWKPITPDNPL